MNKNQFNHQNGKYFPVEDTQIYYETLGNPQKPVLIFLHGGGQEMEMFNPFLPFFVNHFYLIGIDSRGHGKSALGKTLSYQKIQEDVENLLAHLQMGQVNLLGFSDGGVIAYRLAINQKIKINKLVTIGASWHIDDNLAVEKIMRSLNGEVWKNKFPQMYAQYQKLNPDQNFDFFIQKMLEMWLDKSENGFPNEKVQKITCQTLLIRGDQDIFISRESIVKLSHLITDSQILNLPFAGHAVYENQLEMISLALQQFFKEEFLT